MTREYCSFGYSAPFEIIESVHDNQGQTGRHKCAICAFNEGLMDGLNKTKLIENFEKCKFYEEKIALVKTMEKLHHYQGGIARHKCAICAYHEGYKIGLNDSNNLLDTQELQNHVQIISQYKTNKKSPPKSLNITHDESTFINHGHKKNYNEINNKRRNLGLLGEQLVIEYEKNFLIKNKKNDLAYQIVHVSKDKGDGLGYDILSYSLDGSEKFIEVKTTTLGEYTPFYISINELEFSKQYSNFYLYRIFNLNKEKQTADLFVINGQIESNFILTPTAYKCLIK